jgi:hypothetical protein
MVMPVGKYSKWARLDIKETLWLTKAGVSIVVWDKWGKKRKGKLTVSVGGLRWKPYMGKKAVRVTWDELADSLG